MCILLMRQSGGWGACITGAEFRELERRRPGQAAPSVRLQVVFNDNRLRVTTSPASPGPRGNRIEFSSAAYSMRPFDKAMVDRETVDLSAWDGYSLSESKMLTPAVVEVRDLEPGTDVTFAWGEDRSARASQPRNRTCRRRLGRSCRPVPYAKSGSRTGGWAKRERVGSRARTATACRVTGNRRVDEAAFRERGCL
jgi:hypothetical protein